MGGKHITVRTIFKNDGGLLNRIVVQHFQWSNNVGVVELLDEFHFAQLVDCRVRFVLPFLLLVHDFDGNVVFLLLFCMDRNGQVNRAVCATTELQA